MDETDTETDSLTGCRYHPTFLSSTESLRSHASSLNYEFESGNQTCKSTKKVSKATFSIRRSSPYRQADYYWGQHYADVMRAEPMPKFLLDVRSDIMELLNVPKFSPITVEPPAISYGKVGDSVPSLNSCIVNLYDGDDSVVTPHHDGQAGSTPGAQKAVVAGTSIYSLTVCDEGAERKIQLYAPQPGSTKPGKVVYEKELANGSLFELPAAANGAYKHGIPKAPKGIVGARYAFIFRTVVEVEMSVLEKRKREGDRKLAEKAGKRGGEGESGGGKRPRKGKKRGPTSLRQDKQMNVD